MSTFFLYKFINLLLPWSKNCDTHRTVGPIPLHPYQIAVHIHVIEKLFYRLLCTTKHVYYINRNYLYICLPYTTHAYFICLIFELSVFAFDMMLLKPMKMTVKKMTLHWQGNIGNWACISLFKAFNILFWFGRAYLGLWLWLQIQLLLYQ